ncbi:golgin subfamily A member 5 [Aricia agestis]|uniref:golgin subfamily A member 5 n=1 Tax=Aricia agestis TaxID=91739 RepID=UPI001C20739C|nr:golgin subfamily A member 5 [Aricia agestis]
MSWFSDLAGKAESLLNNIDEQTGVALRNASTSKKKHDSTKKSDHVWTPKKKSPPHIRKATLPDPSRSTQTPTNPVSRKPVTGAQPKTNGQKNSSPTRMSGSFYNSLKVVENVVTKNQSTLRKRRNSLPSSTESYNKKDLVYDIKNLEVENTMLKNEINVINSQVSEFITRLQKTEDELSIAQNKLASSEKLNNMFKNTKENLDTQLEDFKEQLSQKNALEISKYKEHSQELEIEVNLMGNKNKNLLERIHYLEEEINTKDSHINKMEKELRHAQTKVAELEGSINKIRNESLSLEKDWESYKLRVKNMLYAKDGEIKALRDGTNLNEDTKQLMVQVESLREEKEDLTTLLSKSKAEQEQTRSYIAQVEEMRAASERLAVALREAVQEERMSRNSAERRCEELSKELQSVKMHMGQTIQNLRLELQDKDDEINLLRETTSNVDSASPSALNVADYDVTNKIQCLTEQLIQKQGKIDSLLADNNILRIQLAKLESKYKSEVSRAKTSHSVVNLHDDVRRRNISVSARIGLMIRRYPVFRTFIMCYVIGLHLWVMTVLFTSTPQDYVPRATKL